MSMCKKHGEYFSEECPKCFLEKQLSVNSYLKRIGDSLSRVGKQESPELAELRKKLNFNESGSKYLRDIPCTIEGKIDVYAVLDAFNVTCPARQHAVKKLLCSGIRGKGDVLQDLKEAGDAITRAIQMEESRSKGEE